MIIKPYIKFQNRRIKEIPSEFFDIKKLIKINFSKNSIHEIPKDIFKLKNIEVLDLSNNKIKQLFSNLFSLTKLKILILNNNKIAHLPHQIGNLKQLKKLQLSNNNIKELPEEMARLSNLKELNISNNQFNKFPDIIFKLNRLESIWIGGNPIESLPLNSILLELPKLKRFYCYSSRLNLDSYDEYYNLLSTMKGNVLSFIKKNRKLLTTSYVNKMNTSNSKIKIFLSYSHLESDWLERVRTNLKVLNFDGVEFECWDDSKIKPGVNWKTEIEESINKSEICILLVSTNFLASDFIRTKELPLILQGAAENGKIILSLIISDCKFKSNKILSSFQALNDPDKPLKSLQDYEIDTIMVRMTERIEDIINTATNK